MTKSAHKIPATSDLIKQYGGKWLTHVLFANKSTWHEVRMAFTLKYVYHFNLFTKNRARIMPIIDQIFFIDSTQCIQRSVCTLGEVYAGGFQGRLWLKKQYSSWPNYSTNFGAQGRTKILFYETKISSSSAVLLRFGSNLVLRIR